MKQILKEGMSKRWLCWFGQNTLTVFAVQKPVIRVFKSVFTKIHIPDFASLILSAVGTVVVSSILCLLINYFVPALAGRQITTEESVSSGKQ